jgi:hypothetical protein
MKVLGLPSSLVPVSGTDRASAVTTGARSSMTPLSTNAIQYQQQGENPSYATPTVRKGNLSVNAIAAQQEGAGQ